MEIALMEAIIDENKDKYPFLEEHFNHLYVRDREYTGVGIYTNFEYDKELSEGEISVLVSSGKSLIINGLENEVTYVLDISDGKINFLEVVTIGDDILNKVETYYDFKLI